MVSHAWYLDGRLHHIYNQYIQINIRTFPSLLCPSMMVRHDRINQQLSPQPPVPLGMMLLPGALPDMQPIHALLAALGLNAKAFLSLMQAPNPMHHIPPNVSQSPAQPSPPPVIDPQLEQPNALQQVLQHLESLENGPPRMTRRTKLTETVVPFVPGKKQERMANLSCMSRRIS